MNEFVKVIDNFVNKITMYKFLLWGLCILAGISWLFSAVGVLPYGAIRPLVGAAVLLIVCYGVNLLLAKFYKVKAVSGESAAITAMLLFFIFQPPKDAKEAVILGVASVIAMASKYVLVKNERHFLNPAAVGAVVVSVTGLLSTRWWVGSDSMFIFVAILGVLLVRKTHRWPMVAAYGTVAFTLAVLRSSATLGSAIQTSLFSFPIIFFGAFMLTEPVTTPPRRYQQVAYGAFVGLLFSSGLSIGSYSMTPEISLIIGNLAVFALARRIRQPLKLVEIRDIGNTIKEYVFKPVVPLKFKAGQYLEITLPVSAVKGRKTDARGNRRSFSIASSPTEDHILLGVKHATPSSTFKLELANLKKGEVIAGNNVAGDFILPIDDRAKLVFIAGGIGITPFRSMLKYLVDSKHNRSITLFYAVSDAKQIVYKDILNEAKEFGLKIVYVLTPMEGHEVPKSWTGEVGFIDQAMIEKHVLDYKKRQFYVSGPDAMVQANKKLLRSIGITRDQIKTDYFSGY